MPWVTGLAVYFVIWWTVLFAILPFGMRSQADDNDIVLGTAHSAPTHFSALTKVAWTTVIALLVFAAFYVATQVYGLSADSFPRFLPSDAGT